MEKTRRENRRWKLDGEFREVYAALYETTAEEANVYYQPPESVKMKYPCILYSRSTGDGRHADDRLYTFTDRYTVSVIDHDPDSPLIDVILNHFKMIRHDRHYKGDNLNHDVFDLYY